MRDIISKNTILASLVPVATRFWGGIDANAQRFNVQGDLVSSYIWCEMHQTGVSIQPTLGFSAGDFSLTAWGSTDFSGTSASVGTVAKEIDLTVVYILGNFGLTFSVADLWWVGQGARKHSNFKNRETAHHSEVGLIYAIQSERFPLSITWYTIFAGQDKNVGGKQNYSSYVELNYSSCVEMVGLNITYGIVSYVAPRYNCDGFTMTNVALKGTTRIRSNDTFTLSILAQVIWNPYMEDAHLMFGIALKP